MRDFMIAAGVLCAVASLVISVWDVIDGRRNKRGRK